MKDVRWNAEKDAWLKARRGVGFEDVLRKIEAREVIDKFAHGNTERYPGQQVLVLELNGYAYYVPFVESENEIFLKTVIPSRKATRKYLRGGQKHGETG